MRGGLAVVLAVLVLVPATASAHEGQRTVEESYRLGLGPLVDARCEEPANRTSGACFPVHAHDDSLSLEIDDRVGEDVAAQYRFEASDGRVYGSGVFCSSTYVGFVPSLEDDAPVERVRVTLLEPFEGARECGNAEAVPTQGTIEATFTSS